MFDPLHLRTAREADASAIAALVNSGYRGEQSLQGWTTEDHLLSGGRIHEQGVRELLVKEGTVVLVFDPGERIEGCVELALRGATLYLGMLTVRPALQGRGLGRVLMEAAERHAREHGCDVITMLVIEERPELIAWYARRGYLPTGEYRPFTNTDPAFGLPRKPLRFMVLEKRLA